MLYYCPLEAYKERYSMQWSAPVTGWLERNWIKANVQYTRVAPPIDRPKSIRIGSVVDAAGRSAYTFAQNDWLLSQAEMGQLTSDDVIYFDDFWHPGLEALPYAFHLMGIKPKMFAFLHAQSVDEFDFTYPMRGWMRSIEKGYGEILDGIFVCCPTLQDLVVQGGIAPREKVHVTGHPFNSEEVAERMDFLQDGDERENAVVWSSRWDKEKNPLFFLAVAEQVIQRIPDAKFYVCSSADRLRSNDVSLLTALDDSIAKYPHNIMLHDGLTKEAYYQRLCESKVQFNCADQDFVAITLLEASVAGCYPIYPYFRSFPETFEYEPGFMYQRGDLDHAAGMVAEVLSEDSLWTVKEIEARAWIHKRFDTSWLRMLYHMDVGHSAQFDFTKELDPYHL